MRLHNCNLDVVNKIVFQFSVLLDMQTYTNIRKNKQSMPLLNTIKQIKSARKALYNALLIRRNRYPSTRFNIINTPPNPINPTTRTLILPPLHILRLAGMEPGLFGHTAEKLITQRLNLLPPIAHNHDTWTLDGSRVEIKCARYKINNWEHKIQTPHKLNYCWKRVNINNLDTGYDLLLLALLTEWGFDIRVLDKQQIINLAQIINSAKPTSINIHFPFGFNTNQSLNIVGYDNVRLYNYPGINLDKLTIHRDDLNQI